MIDEQGSDAQDSPWGNSLSDALEGWDMDVDPATGEFVFTETQEPVVEGAAVPSAEGTLEPRAEPETPGESSPGDQDPATLLKRLKDTQAALTKANQANADLNRKLQESDDQFAVLNVRVDSVMEMLERASRNQRPQEPEVGDIPEDGFDTPQQLKAYLDSQIQSKAQELFEERLNENPVVRQLSQEMEIRAELQEAVEAYPDFPRYAEEVRKVINRYPQMTFKQAYEVVQEFVNKGEGNSSQTPNAPAASPTPQPKPVSPMKSGGGAIGQQSEGNALVDDAIADRARRLGNVEHPTQGSGVGRGPVKNVRDAMERALEELNMS